MAGERHPDLGCSTPVARWRRITDTPTRIRESIWTAATADRLAYTAGAFQATDEQGESFVFDVYRAEHDWHVHRSYR